jgi:SAM-dependent methyltransferase
MIAPEILAFYAAGGEERRLTASIGRLEFIRTWEILERHLPATPCRIVDVGGGTGIYALPLAALGHRVHLTDPVPLHVERARASSSASPTPLEDITLGDARRLPAPDGAFDAVLLFGPLYHLTARADRVRAIAEAKRVLAPGGVLLAAYISRFASACDGIQEGALRDPEFAAIVEGDLTTGVHENSTGRPEWFTTAYFHRPEEVQPEIEEAGLQFEALLAVEGPGWMNQALDSWLDDHEACERLLAVLRRVEAEPSLLGASAHLIAVARARP